MNRLLVGLRYHWSLIKYTIIKIKEEETLFIKAKNFFIIATSNLSFDEDFTICSWFLMNIDTLLLQKHSHHVIKF